MSRPFPPARPHGSLREVFPGVHLVSGTMSLGPMSFSRNMVVVQQDDRLVLVNTIRLDPAGLDALDALGKVSDVVRIAGFHGSDDAFYKDRYDCTVHAIEGQRYFTGINAHKGETYFHADAPLNPADLPIEGASLYVIETDPPEGILRIPAGGGTLITGDSLQNWDAPDEHFNWIARFGMRLMGFIGPCRIGAGWAKDLKPDPTEVRGILDLEFTNVLPGHGQPVLGDAPERYRPAIEAYGA